MFKQSVFKLPTNHDITQRNLGFIFDQILLKSEYVENEKGHVHKYEAVFGSFFGRDCCFIFIFYMNSFF